MRAEGPGSRLLLRAGSGTTGPECLLLVGRGPPHWITPDVSLPQGWRPEEVLVLDDLLGSSRVMALKKAISCSERLSAQSDRQKSNMELMRSSHPGRMKETLGAMPSSRDYHAAPDARHCWRLTQRVEDIQLGVFPLKEDGVVVAVVRPAHSQQQQLHRTCKNQRGLHWVWVETHEVSSPCGQTLRTLPAFSSTI